MQHEEQKQALHEVAPPDLTIHEAMEADLVHCRRCNREVAREDMKRDVRKRNGLSSYCRRCHAEASSRWQKENPDRVRAIRRARYLAEDRLAVAERRRKEYDADTNRWHRLRYLYKLDRNAYEQLLMAQGGLCAICNGEHVGRGKFLHVDHDHQCCPTTPTCGHCTRGLLCGPCNLALTKTEEEGWIDKARAYLGSRVSA